MDGQPADVTRVAVSAEVRLHQEGISELLSGEARIEVVGTAAGADETFDLVERERPDVLLVDGTTFTDPAWIADGRDRCRDVGIVFIASPADEADTLLARVEAGVLGVLEFGESRADLVDAVQKVARGEARWPSRITGTLVKRLADRTDPPSTPKENTLLTIRELEVLRLIDEGLSNKQIAAHLHIKLATVKHHVHHILEKLGAERRGEAVALGRRAGLLPPHGVGE